MFDDLAYYVTSGNIQGVWWERGVVRPDVPQQVVRLHFVGKDGREWTVEPTADGSDVAALWLYGAEVETAAEAAAPPAETDR